MTKTQTVSYRKLSIIRLLHDISPLSSWNCKPDEAKTRKHFELLFRTAKKGPDIFQQF